jgi:hypothetical protein
LLGAALLDMALLSAGAAFSLEAEFSAVFAAFCLQALKLAAARAASETRAKVRTGVMGYLSSWTLGVGHWSSLPSFNCSQGAV